MNIIKVAGHSRSTAVAGAIAGMVREQGKAEIQAIGAGSVNQAIKAVAIARSYLVQDGLDLAVIPHFVLLPFPEGERTALRLYVEVRDTEFAPRVPREDWRERQAEPVR